MTDTDPFVDVIGQEQAKHELRAASLEPVHAYLFLGPRGSGKRRAAARFAGEVIGDQADRARVRRLAALEEHPDLVVFEPEGTALRTPEVEPIIVEASRSPVEGGRKVLVIDRFHEATPEAAAKLLKPIEEPAAPVIFVLLTEEVPPEHITIASRSTQIDFPAVPVETLETGLIARGVDPQIAKVAAVGSGGDVSRAELLVTDAAFVERRALWWDAPSRLAGGSGFEISEIVRELRSAVDVAQVPLDARQANELEQLAEVEEMTGTRGSGRRAIEARHRREARAHRNDELRMGLATLAQRYRAEIPAADTAANFEALNDAAEGLIRNPSEELWLTALLSRLTPIST